jgi:hypothetical protein
MCYNQIIDNAWHIKRRFNMPVISRFNGISIMMYIAEHNPPHFHVKYNEYEAMMDIRTLEVIVGSIPKKELELVKTWASQYQDILLEMWNSKELTSVPPLA